MDLKETPAGEFRRHPWELARLRFFRGLLARHGLTRGPRRVLDVGAGDAWFARQLLDALPANAHITCWDSAYGAEPPFETDRISFCREAPPGPFQLQLMLDVLEHVEDHAAFLRSVLERLEAGGWVLVSVPAWSHLTSAHDAALAHYRRFHPADGRALLTGTGLRVLESGGLFHGLLLVRGATVLLERLTRSNRVVDPTLEWKWGLGLGKVVESALAIDNTVSAAAARHGLSLPGLSWWALCQKP